jgi:hypothetical protein
MDRNEEGFEKKILLIIQFVIRGGSVEYQGLQFHKSMSSADYSFEVGELNSIKLFNVNDLSQQYWFHSAMTSSLLSLLL